MKYLPITLTATLLASLLVAMVFTPVLGAVFGKARRDGDHDVMLTLEQGHVNDLKSMPGWLGRYVRLVDWAIDRPARILPSGVGSCWRSTLAYFMFGKGVEFFPDVEPQTTLLQIHGRGNLSIDERDTLVREVEAQDPRHAGRTARVQDRLYRHPRRRRHRKRPGPAGRHDRHHQYRVRQVEPAPARRPRSSTRSSSAPRAGRHPGGGPQPGGRTADGQARGCAVHLPRSLLLESCRRRPARASGQDGPG